MEQVKTNKRALLITGTIVPNSNFVVHVNVEQRRQEYFDALKFYYSEFTMNFLKNINHHPASLKQKIFDITNSLAPY